MCTRSVRGLNRLRYRVNGNYRRYTRTILGDAARVSLHRCIFMKNPRVLRATSTCTFDSFGEHRESWIIFTVIHTASPDTPLTLAWSKSKCIVEDEYRWSGTSPWVARWPGMNIEAEITSRKWIVKDKCPNGISRSWIAKDEYRFERDGYRI